MPAKKPLVLPGFASQTPAVQALIPGVARLDDAQETPQDDDAEAYSHPAQGHHGATEEETGEAGQR